MEKVGVGIIGTGFARRVQIPAFVACDGADVVSVSSGSAANAAATAAEFNIRHHSGDWRATVLHADVDLVCITTPPDLHREMALLAIEQGKHILCEKPMAMNAAEAEEMCSAAESSPVLALIDHELRFQPGRIAAREMILSGEIGDIRHSKAIFRAPHRGDPNVAWNWWSDESRGGGALGAIGSHIIDSFHWFLDCDIASVTCQLATQIKQRPAANGEMLPVTSDDEANMLLRFADGPVTNDTTGLVSISMIEGPDYANVMEFYGSKGVIRVGHRGEFEISRNGGAWESPIVDLGDHIDGLPDTGFARAFVNFAPHIVDAIRSGRRTVPGAATFNDGLLVQKVLDAARLSSDEARSVSPV
jgi:predicted dehydrogenase